MRARGIMQNDAELRECTTSMEIWTILVRYFGIAGGHLCAREFEKKRYRILDLFSPAPLHDCGVCRLVKYA